MFRNTLERPEDSFRFPESRGTLQTVTNHTTFQPTRGPAEPSAAGELAEGCKSSEFGNGLEQGEGIVLRGEGIVLGGERIVPQ